MDLLLLEQYDPSLGEQTRHPLRDALRALGVDGSSAYLTTADQLPGLVLEHVDTRLCPALEGEYTWTLWGRAERIMTAVGDVKVYGGELYGAISHVVDEGIRSFFARLAASDFLRLKHQQNALLRDTARVQHGKFGRRDLRKLREEFLTSSLDVNTFSEDIRLFVDEYRPYSNDPVFMRRLAPWAAIPKENKSGILDALRGWFTGQRGGSADAGEFDRNVNNEIDRQLIESSEALVAFDSDYRDILSTVAALGTSIDAFKVQRYVLWVAVVSAVVALAALTVTVLGIDKTEAIITVIRHWTHL
jgi:hypothetical protein